MKTFIPNNGKSKRNFGYILTLLFTISLTAFTINETTPFKSVGGSQLRVNGTSNIHDWTMNATGFVCEGNYILKGDQLQDLSSLNFTLPVANLKGKEDLLNTRAHKALKAEQFSRITFRLSTATVIPQQKIIKAAGNLTIAGVTKPIVLEANYTVNGNEITCKGSETIKMSDYNIKAPTFMMGALKVADAVVIDITLKLKN
jgi:hypothetical protein